jgi:hypothetical protein
VVVNGGNIAYRTVRTSEINGVLSVFLYLVILWQGHRIKPVSVPDYINTWFISSDNTLVKSCVSLVAFTL